MKGGSPPMTGKKREEGEEYKFLASYVTLNLCVT